MDASQSRRDGRWALLLLALGIVLVFAEAFAGRAPIMRDFVGFTYPSRAAFRAVLERGDLSSWNPLAELGLSRLAAPVHGALYPGHLFLAIGDLETGVVLTWMLHVVWAAWGGYLLARAAGVRPFAAIISGAVWALSGYAVSMWWNGEKVLTDAWLPWFALAIERASAARAPLSPWGALAALAAAMVCYAGDPFLLLHAVGLALAVVLARPAGPSRRGRWGELGRAALATGLGLGLATPAWLCAIAARGDTSRSAPLALGMAEAWSFHPARLAELFLPGWSGKPFDVAHYPGAAFSDDPTRQALPWAVSVYCGAALLVFAPCVRSRRALASVGGVAVFFLLLALGRHTPLNAIVCQLVPGLSLFRYPEKHLVVVVGLLGLLAAIGAERALSQRISGWHLLAPPLAVTALALALTMALGEAPLRGTSAVGAAHVVLASLLLVGCVELAHRRATWTFAVALVAVLDLAVSARPFLRWAERPLFVSPLAGVLASRLEGPPPRIYRPRSDDFEDPATFPGSAGQVFGIAALPGHDPASSLRLSTVLKRIAGDPIRMAKLLALDAFLLPTGTAVDIEEAASLRGTSLYLLARPLRAWIVGSVRRESTAEALGSMASEAFDPQGEAIVAADDDGALALLGQGAPGGAGTCAITDYDRARVDLRCDARQDGLVVLSELYADGWSATLDDHEARLLPADLVLRGVAVKQGIHRISMRYETPGLAEGAVVAGASALLLLLGLSWFWIRDKTQAVTTSR